MRKLLLGIAALALLLPMQVASADTETIFDYIPSPVPDNVASYSYESWGVAEAGDGIEFSTNGNQTLDSARVLVSSWACEDGTGWAAENTVPCETTPGSTYPVSITLNLYDPNDDMSLIDTTTQTFNIPFRPSASEGCEPTENGHGWGPDCVLGLAHAITFNLTGVVVPDEIVYGVAWNTASFGYDPIGNGPACQAVQYAGCDSSLLNLGTDGNAPPFVGTDLSPQGAWQYAAFPESYCDGGTGGINVFRFDDGCWGGFNPQVEFARFVQGGGGGGGGGGGPTPTPTPTPGECTITGTGGADTLTGTPGPDVICGKGGPDLLKGKQGDDLLKGGAGADTLKGGKGFDTCKGGKGKDTIKGCEA
jgi:Ca2+-binding RTX toxin-like protein